MQNVHTIALASCRLRRFCRVMIFILPIMCGLFWGFFNQLYSPSSFFPTSMIPLPVPVDGDLSGLVRLLACLTAMIPLSVLIFGLYKLRELFGYYEKGCIFSGRTVSCFRSLGRALILWVVCDVATTPLLGLVLTMEQPPGRHVLVLGLFPADFIAAFVGAVIMLIAWVMDEARLLYEDQALII